MTGHAAEASEGPTGWRRPGAQLALLIGVAAVVRLGVLAAVFPPGLTGDELYYTDTALHIAQGQGHYSKMYRAHAGWPPGQAFALSLVAAPDPDETWRTLGQDTLVRFLLLQTLLGTVFVAAVAWLGRALFDARTGLLAGAIAAVYPTFVFYSHALWSCTLFVLLAVAALAAAATAARTGRLAWVVAAGVGFGLATLTREEGLLMAGCVALWWLHSGVPAAGAGPAGAAARRAALARGALLLACTGLVVAPWTLRNHAVLDAFVPVSTVGWMGIREGNTLSGESWLRPDLASLRAFRTRYFALDDEMARVSLARREAIDLVAAEQPLWIAKKLVRNSALFFSPDSFAFKKISRGRYGPPRLAWVRIVLVLSVVGYLAVMAGAIVGLARAPVRGQRLLPLTVTAAVFGLHVLANASSRYRIALMPLAVVYAAHAWVGGRASGRLSERARLACGVAMALLLGWPLVYVAADLVSLWTSGTYVEPGRP